MRIKNHTKPTGVPAFRPEVKMVVCENCGAKIREDRSHTIGNEEWPEGNVFCSLECVMTAFNKFKYLFLQTNRRKK